MFQPVQESLQSTLRYKESIAFTIANTSATNIPPMIYKSEDQDLIIYLFDILCIVMLLFIILALFTCRLINNPKMALKNFTRTEILLFQQQKQVAMSIFLDPCTCQYYYFNYVRKKCPYQSYFLTNRCVSSADYKCNNPWERVGFTAPFNKTLCRILWPLDSVEYWNMYFKDQGEQKFTFSTTSTTSPPTDLSTTGDKFEYKPESPQPNPLTIPLIVFVCISVLLLIIIIILVCRRVSGKKIIPACACFQKTSEPPAESDLDYVEPNNVRHGTSSNSVERPALIPGNCHRTTSENRSPETENEDHAYIYLQDNTYRNQLPNANMRVTIPEVVYSDSELPDIEPNGTIKADPVYQIIDPATVSDSRTHSSGTDGGYSSSSANEYHYVEPSSVTTDND